MDEIYQRQQERKRNEHYYGDWNVIRAHILAASGAGERVIAGPEPIALQTRPCVHCTGDGCRGCDYTGRVAL